ncbi:IZH family channel protein-like protein [Aaosphaeria arxii CBS 175.79]|uniref:IZH family channel protein-like protein n=1 Tax=Aaosphaeria arxii CBS 175.79 TaxID=1450172 RepID=A0A6A5XSX2_9PLEO|nr:IZH family channel protein-like protein [Aaosphaeria arxii CBS 175.79]KAF2016043.1 IZH family channel protein-like protein [Aaosphaeria arxii CBS 175.79]
MACSGTSTAVQMSQEEPLSLYSYGTFSREEQRRRRHSSHHSSHSRPWAVDAEHVHEALEHFISELGCRLDFLESYGHLKFDAGVEYAYSTLLAVRESCSKISDEALEAGRRRAGVFVETLEERYQDALASKESFDQKVQEGLRLMEEYLTEFETRAYAIRDSGIGSVAQEFYEGGRRKVDEGFERAKGVVDGGIDKARRARETIELTIEHAVERALARAKEHGLIQYEDLPDPWKINPHIHKGYRFSEGKWACVRSMVSMHNEFFNIWSHAVGLLIILTVAFYFYPRNSNFSLSTNSDIFIAAVFFFAAAKCLVCSTIWHTMNSISHQTLLERFACVDYTGISLLVAASIMTTEYAAFYCEPNSRWMYMLTTAFLGIGGVILPWHPTFNRQDMAWLRVVFYVSLAATGFLPVGQLAMTRGIEWAYYFYAPVTKSILVYLIGAIMYASKIPERWFPGRFDYVGCSHNIWHVAVLFGILFHYNAMQTMFAHALQRAQTHCSIY